MSAINMVKLEEIANEYLAGQRILVLTRIFDVGKGFSLFPAKNSDIPLYLEDGGRIITLKEMHELKDDENCKNKILAKAFLDILNNL